MRLAAMPIAWRPVDRPAKSSSRSIRAPAMGLTLEAAHASWRGTSSGLTPRRPQMLGPKWWIFCTSA